MTYTDLVFNSLATISYTSHLLRLCRLDQVVDSYGGMSPTLSIQAEVHGPIIPQGEEMLDLEDGRRISIDALALSPSDDSDIRAGDLLYDVTDSQLYKIERRTRYQKHTEYALVYYDGEVDEPSLTPPTTTAATTTAATTTGGP
jgi:hypothetical protein